MEKNPWAFRSAQLDARVLVSDKDFRHFVDFIHDYGYNTLTLYLEGMIRTKSFPYRSPQESYSPEQMRDWVKYAEKRSIELIPVVSALGHAQIFLEQDALRHLAELREGTMGRFYKHLMVFCPSLDETYSFLGRYLAEIAAIFPSKYFHVGCDESWDIGYCSLCKARMARGETEGQLYGKHMQRIHEMVTRQMGKRMLMWDDMLELYPEALELLPSDVIMCVWQYDEAATTKSHFGPWRWDERLQEYARRGNEYVIATRELSAANIESFTRFARASRPLGGLVTSWDLSVTSLAGYYPNIAFAGRRWNDPSAENGEEIFKEANAGLFGLRDPVFLQGIWAAKSLGPWPGRSQPESFLRGPLTPYEFDRRNAVATLEKVLQPYHDKIPSETGRSILKDILSILRREMVQHELRLWVEEVYSCWSRGGGDEALSHLIQRGEKLMAVLPDTREIVERLIKTMRSEKNPPGLLRVRYAILNYYSGVRAVWKVQYDGETGWETAYEGGPTPAYHDYSETQYFVIESPIRGDRAPRRLRVEVTGYGGIEIQYVAAQNRRGLFIPVAVENQSGLVEGAERLLVNDIHSCRLGEEEARKAFFQREHVTTKHSLEIVLKQKDFAHVYNSQ